MSSHPTASTALTILMMTLFSLCVVQGVPNTKIIQVLCNSVAYSEGDPFGDSLAYVVADLEAQTPKRKGYDYFNISPYPNAFAYGHAACDGNITSSDCGACLGAAKTTMFDRCPTRNGARSVLVDCKIRYEKYPFND